MDREEVARVLEAVLFASPEPVALAKLVELLAPEGLGRQEVLEGLAALGEALDGRALELREVAGGYQLRTRAGYAPYLGRLEIPRPVRFSRAAMETLAIVVYRQPVTRAEVEEIRGVDCGGVLKALLEKGLVRVVGKKDVPGRPLLYGTSRKFLEVFGLTSLADLPSLQEIEEMLAEEGGDETGEAPEVRQESQEPEADD